MKCVWLKKLDDLNCLNFLYDSSTIKKKTEAVLCIRLKLKNNICSIRIYWNSYVHLNYAIQKIKYTSVYNNEISIVIWYNLSK